MPFRPCCSALIQILYLLTLILTSLAVVWLVFYILLS